MTTPKPTPTMTLPCTCPCHPQPGIPNHHRDGQPCRCELTPEQQAERRTRILELLEDIRHHSDQHFKEEKNTILTIFTNAGAHITHYLPAAPFVVAGTINGHGFYLRERWEMWHLVVENTPGRNTNIWENRDTPATVIAEGTLETDYPHLAQMSVEHLHDHLTRITCHHTVGDRFCPHCGIKLDAEHPNPEPPQ